MELTKMGPEWVVPLKDFLDAIESRGEGKYFSPHAADEENLRARAAYQGQDVYLLLVEERRVLGYGLLRGWDEGYAVPSLGIAVHPSVRGAGFASALMVFLHAQARYRGASKVRLRVHAENQRAISLYIRLGYTFTPDNDRDGYLLGFKDLIEATK